MAVTQAGLAVVARFRDMVDRYNEAQTHVINVTREDRRDDTSLCSRYAVAPRLWLEVCVRPNVPQVRVGIMTDDRWLSEELEDAIEETGDTMSEFIELGFDEVGLDWPDPPVEHYRDQGKYFYFSTGWELDSLDALDQPAVRERVQLMLNGYHEAFRKAIDRARQAAE